MRRLTYEGLWWLPELPDRDIAGKLEIYPDKPASLRLFGSFRPEEKLFRQDVVRYTIVFGVTSDAKEMTLVRALEVGTYFSSPGYMSQELSPALVLVGGHFTNPEERPVAQAWAEYPWMPEWVNWRISGPVGEPKVELTDIPDVVANIHGTVVTLTHGWAIDGESHRSRTLSLEPKLRVEPRPEATIADLERSWFRPFEYLLVLATKRPNVLARYVVRFVDTDNHQRIDVLAPRTQADSEHRAPRPDELLFSLSDIESDWETIFGRWLASFEDLREVYDLYFSTTLGFHFQEPTFLTLAQAIELFDRRRESNQVLPVAEHRLRKRAILAEFVEPVRSWLTDKLAHSNEPTLRDRATRLVDRSRPATNVLIPDRDAFAELFANTRNYYTHYSPQLRRKAAKGVELAKLNERLRGLIDALLLGETGMDAQKIETAVARRGSPDQWGVT